MAKRKAKKVSKVESVGKTVERGSFKGKGITPKFGDTAADVKFADKANNPKFGV